MSEEENVDIDADSSDELFVPEWSVKRGTRMKNSSVCRDMMVHLATLGEEKFLDAHDNSEALKRSWLLLGKGASEQADLRDEHEKLVAHHKVCGKSFEQNWKRFSDMAEELKKVKDEHVLERIWMNCKICVWSMLVVRRGSWV